MTTKAIIIATIALVCVLAVGVWWLEAAPTVGATAASPAYIVINTPTPVTITASITDSTLLTNGVNLLRTDTAGKTLSTVGVMHDDGLNGDAKAGDKIFSYRLTINQSTVGQVYYRVSVAFKGVLQRSLSSVVAVTVDPFQLPPDPGEKGKQTLIGIDVNANGIRDDLERFIGYEASGSAEGRAALTQYAVAIQASVEGSSDGAIRGVVAVRCIASVLGIDAMPAHVASLRKAALNTPDRVRAYLVAMDQLNTGIPPPPSDLRDSCRLG